MKFKKPIFVLFFILGILSFQQPAYAIRFVVYGDSRGDFAFPPSPPSTFNEPVLGYINSQITSLNPAPDFVCFLGDAVMNPTNPATALHDWHTFMTTTLKGIPYYVIAGNHDISDDEGFQTKYDLQLQFQLEFNTMPDNGPSALYKYLCYSFEYGTGDSRSLFAFLDSYIITDSSPPINYYGDYEDTQVDWFQKQIAASTAPHKFVLAHSPFFSPNGLGPYFDPPDISVGLGNRRIWDSLTDFDLAFCAHEHLYSRWSLYPATPIRAPQILTGTCGAPVEPGFNFPPQAHVFSGENLYNFAVVDVEGKNVILHAYGVKDHKDGTFTIALIDTVRVTK